MDFELASPRAAVSRRPLPEFHPLPMDDGWPGEESDDEMPIDSTKRTVLLRRARLGATELHQAAFMGDVEGVRALLRAGERIDAIDSEERTVLHYGVAEEGAAVIPVLIDAGISINGQDVNGDTALHVAAQRGEMAAVMELVRRDARRDLRSRWGETALEVAEKAQHWDVVTFLQDRDRQHAMGSRGVMFRATPQQFHGGTVRDRPWGNGAHPYDVGQRVRDDDVAGMPLQLAVEFGGQDLSREVVYRDAAHETRDGEHGARQIVPAAGVFASDRDEICNPRRA
jgi:hypothetical protein